MNIINLIDNLRLADTPTVLNSCWTSDKSLCSPSMIESGEQMLNDMIECQDLIAALYYADKIGIDIPKLSANIILTDDSWVHSISVKILSPVSEDFFKLYSSIQDGEDIFGLKNRERTQFGHFITQSDKMKQFIFSTHDNVRIINATQKQR